MHHRVWVWSCLPCKRNSNSYVEVLQRCFNDWNSFTWPYGVCWELWNELKWPETPSGVAAAYSFKWEFGFVIMMFQKYEKCLDSFYMLYWMCQQHWFGLECSQFENSMLTWGKWELEQKRGKCVNKGYVGFGVHFHIAWSSIYMPKLRIGVLISALGCKWLKW